MDPYVFDSGREALYGKRTSRRNLHAAKHSTERGDEAELRRMSTMSVDSNKSSKHSTNAFDHSSYDPELDVEAVQKMAEKNKVISVWKLFRYSNQVELAYMGVASFIVIASSILIPWIMYLCGKLLLLVSLDMRSQDKLRWTSTSILQNEASTFFVDVMLAALVLAIATYASSRCFGWAADFQTKRMTIKYFEAIVRKDLAWFDIYVDREFANVMNEEISKIRVGIGENIPELMYQIATQFLLLILAFTLNYKLTLFLLGVGLVFYCLSYLWTFAYIQQQVASGDAFVKAGLFAEDVLCNIKTVKLYKCEKFQISHFSNYLRSTRKAQLRWIFAASISGGVFWMGLYWTLAAYVWIANAVNDDIWKFHGLILTNAGKRSHCFSLDEMRAMTCSSSVVVLMAIGYIAYRLRRIPDCIHKILEAKHKAAELFFIIDWVPRIDNFSPLGKMPKKFTLGRIQLKNVSFKYPKTPTVYALRNVKLFFYPYQIIGIFGREPDAGQSTVLKLIMRLYDTFEGKIDIDGVDLQAYNTAWLRSQMIFISHDTIVIPVSIKENIRVTRTTTDMTAVMEACKAVGVHDEIEMLPRGYDTLLDGGIRSDALNPIQMRKVALARAVFMKPKVVLIDDHLVLCDERLEEAMLGMISKLRYKSTVIIAACRANYVMKHCDHVYFMEDGEVVEHGNHAELLEGKKDYYKMIQDTMNLPMEPTAQFTSQLTAYKFAKALRSANEKKRRDREKAMNMANRDPVHQVVTLMSQPLDELEYKRFHYTGYGYGGFQNYCFAQAKDLIPGKLLKKLFKFKSQTKEMEIMRRTSVAANKSRRSRLRSHASVHVFADGETPNVVDNVDEYLPPVHVRNLRISEIGSGGVHLAPANAGTLTRASVASSQYNVEGDDNVSICSEDSEEFWEYYIDKIEALRHFKTRGGTWKELYGVGLVKSSLLYLFVGILSSIAIGVSVTVGDVLIGKACYLLMKTKDSEEKRDMKEVTLELILFGAVRGFAVFFREWCFSMAGFKTCTGLRVSMMFHLLRQEIQWFDIIHNDISILCEKVARDTDVLQHVLISWIGILVENLSSVIASLTWACILIHGWKGEKDKAGEYFLLFAIVGLAVVMLLCRYSLGYLTSRQTIMMEGRMEKASDLCWHVISNIRSVLIMGLQKYYGVIFEKSVGRFMRKFYVMSEARCILASLTRVFEWVILAWFIKHSFKYLAKEAEPRESEYSTLFIIVPLILLRLGSIGDAICLLTPSFEGKAAAHSILSTHLRHLHHRKSSTTTQNNPWPSGTPALELLDIHFSFDRRRVLKGINLVLEPKTCVAITGLSPSGKTTLANVLAGLYTPNAGVIFLNHEDDLDDFQPNYLASITALLEQDSGIIHDLSIEDNILLGGPFTQDEMIQAARLASAHYDILALNDGYKTRMDLHSPMFTAGFKHKLSLARALLRKPKILVVDDIYSTGIRDFDTALRSAIDHVTAEGIVIIFSQKVTAIRDIEQIYMMKDGRIVEGGTHSALLAKQGSYYELYMFQRMLVLASRLSQQNRVTSSQDLETVAEIKRQVETAASSGKRQSSIAFTSYLASEIDRMREQFDQKKEAIEEEVELTKKLEKQEAAAFKEREREIYNTNMKKQENEDRDSNKGNKK